MKIVFLKFTHIEKNEKFYEYFHSVLLISFQI